MLGGCTRGGERAPSRLEAKGGNSKQVGGADAGPSRTGSYRVGCAALLVELVKVEIRREFDAALRARSSRGGWKDISLPPVAGRACDGSMFIAGDSKLIERAMFDPAPDVVAVVDKEGVEREVEAERGNSVVEGLRGNAPMGTSDPDRCKGPLDGGAVAGGLANRSPGVSGPPLAR